MSGRSADRRCALRLPLSLVTQTRQRLTAGRDAVGSGARCGGVEHAAPRLARGGASAAAWPAAPCADDVINQESSAVLHEASSTLRNKMITMSTSAIFAA